MTVQAQDYKLMRAWFAHMARATIPSELLSSDVDPVVQLDDLASRSRAKARQGLSMAIYDLIELTEHWPHERVAEIDLSLHEDGLPSLTEMRRRFSKLVQRVLRRGSIRDDVEYHAVRNAAEMQEERGRLSQIIAAYETAAAAGT